MYVGWIGQSFDAARHHRIKLESHIKFEMIEYSKTRLGSGDCLNLRGVGINHCYCLSINFFAFNC